MRSTELAALPLAVLAAICVSCAGRTPISESVSQVESNLAVIEDPILACSFSVATQIKNDVYREEALVQIATELLAIGDDDGAELVFQTMPSHEAHAFLMPPVAMELLKRGKYSPALVLYQRTQTPDWNIIDYLLKTAYHDVDTKESASAMLDIALALAKSEEAASNSLAVDSGYHGGILAKTGHCSEAWELIETEEHKGQRILFQIDALLTCADTMTESEIQDMLERAHSWKEKGADPEFFPYRSSDMAAALVVAYVELGMVSEARETISTEKTIIGMIEGTIARDLAYLLLACGCADAGLFDEAREIASEFEEHGTQTFFEHCLIPSYVENQIHDKALEIAIEMQSPALKVYVLADIARGKIDSGEIDEAASVLFEALDIIRTSTTWDAKTQVHDEVARLFIEIGQTEQALAVSDALPFYTEDRVLWLVAESHAKAGDAQQALDTLSSITGMRVKAFALLDVSRSLPAHPWVLSKQESSSMNPICQE